MARPLTGPRSVDRPGDEVFIPKSVARTVCNPAPTTTRWLYGYD